LEPPYHLGNYYRSNVEINNTAKYGHALA